MTLQRVSTDGWPEWCQRQYDFYTALYDLWIAMSEHPLIRPFKPVRYLILGRALVALEHAAEAEREALELLALRASPSP